MPTAKTDQEELVRSFHTEVLTGKNLDAVVDLISEDYVEHNPALPGGEVRGRDNMVDFWEGLFDAFPDMSISETDIISEDDTVVTRHTGRATHEGEFMDLEPTGESFEIDGIDVYRIEDGKIAEAWVSIDMLGMMQQLGAMPEGVPADE